MIECSAMFGDCVTLVRSTHLLEVSPNHKKQETTAMQQGNENLEHNSMKRAVNC